MKKYNFDVPSFLAGICVTTWLVIIMFFAAGGSINIGGNNMGTKTESESEDSNSSGEDEKKVWNTSQLSHTFKVDGKTLTFHTPKGFYSITDQYLDNMAGYYGKQSVKSESFFVVGDNKTASEATQVINANKLSDVKSVLKQLYGDEYKEDEIKDAPAFTYMKTGKVPDDAPDNYKIKEVEKVTVSGVTFTIFEDEYDTTYDVPAEETKDKSDAKNKEKESEKETVHSKEMCAYSDTEDPIEVLVYMNEYDKDTALKNIKEYLGAK